jgi:hypothetical protein
MDVPLTRALLPAALTLALATGCGDEGAPAPAPGPGPGVCAAPPSLPLAFTRVMGPPSSEDFTFDGDGYLLALEGGSSLVKVARGERPMLVEPNVVVNGRGLRVLPGGDVIIADQDRSLLVRLERSGNVRRLTTTIVNPNGVQLGPGGKLFVTDFGAVGEVYRVDPDSGDTVALARPSEASNGLTFSPDRSLLYVGDHDAGVLYRLRLRADGTAEPPQPFAAGLGKPDGLATDECGDLYAASWDRNLYRISTTGEVSVAATFPAAVSAVSFGSGRQGWNERRLYVMAIQEGGVYELDLGRRAPPAP